jgi:glycolate oxidase FAD binding subunit
LDEHTCTIDDAGPFPVVRPADLAELSELVRGTKADQAVFPLGGRTLLAVGRPPARGGTGLDLRGLDRVIDYPACDMTITVQAGVTIARLRDILRAEGQRLPVDVPQPERATLGGSLAVNVSGPRRLGFGTFRDYVIGISTINDEGQETKAGGRVVKNVAGYDLCKLHVGALGSLGIISQVTLKLRPLPEETALVVCRCDEADIGPLLDLAHTSRTRPVCVELLNPPAASGLPGDRHGWCVVVGFEESIETVRWEMEQLIKELLATRTRSVDGLVGSAATAEVWGLLTEFQLRPAARLTFKANLLPHSVADFCRMAARLDETMELQAHAGSGIVFGQVGGDLTMERARTILQQLQESATREQGNVVVRQCPYAWKATLPIWGAPRGDAALMAEVRARMAPRGVLNPGRFLV